MDLKDVVKLSANDIEWLKKINNCGELICPKYLTSSHFVHEKMRDYNRIVRGDGIISDSSYAELAGNAKKRYVFFSINTTGYRLIESIYPNGTIGIKEDWS